MDRSVSSWGLARTVLDARAMHTTLFSRPKFNAFALLALAALTLLPGCAGQGYIGDRCAALGPTDNVLQLPTGRPVDLNERGVTRITGPSGVGTHSFVRAFSCCARDEVYGDAGCEVNCDEYRRSIGAVTLDKPYAGELCNGASYGSATCTVFYNSEGYLVGTVSRCYD